jgi:hypothetical protein
MDPYVIEVNRDLHGDSTIKGYDNELRYEGYIIDLLDQLASLLGFNYRITIVEDGLYGFQKSDGTWNGMIGDVMRKVRLVHQGKCDLLTISKRCFADREEC